MVSAFVTALVLMLAFTLALPWGLVATRPRSVLRTGGPILLLLLSCPLPQDKITPVSTPLERARATARRAYGAGVGSVCQRATSQAGAVPRPTAGTGAALGDAEQCGGHS